MESSTGYFPIFRVRIHHISGLRLLGAGLCPTFVSVRATAWNAHRQTIVQADSEDTVGSHYLGEAMLFNMTQRRIRRASYNARPLETMLVPWEPTFVACYEPIGRALCKRRGCTRRRNEDRNNDVM